MSNTTQSFAFMQGGQTQIHKMRMLKQVTISTFKISLFMGIVTFAGSVAAIKSLSII